jgi:KDO2-lipid IV(A) lauroyltransferase
MWLLAKLPFGVLHLLGDLSYLIMYRLMRYRLRVVRRNLERSFPEMATKRRRQIERQFYHFLADCLLEDLKTMHLSQVEMCRRMTYHHTEQFLRMIDKHGGIVLMIPHYANYEWIIGMGGIMNPGDVPVQVYKPLKDKYLDALFRRIRSRFGGMNVPKHSTARELVKLKRSGKKMVVGLITDQWPGADEKYWTTFLHQDTAFLTGAERIAKLMDYPVFYCELSKPRRGYCEVTFRLMTECPKATGDGEITEMFARHLEATICREPAYWLWSHKRWKAPRESEERHPHIPQANDA